MNVYWKLGVLAAWTLLVGFTAWHAKGRFDEAAQLDAVQQAIAEHDKLQQMVNVPAQKAEAAAQAEQTKGNQLTQQWSSRHVQDSCGSSKLPAASLRLFKAGTKPAASAAFP